MRIHVCALPGGQLQHSLQLWPCFAHGARPPRRSVDSVLQLSSLPDLRLLQMGWPMEFQATEAVGLALLPTAGHCWPAVGLLAGTLSLLPAAAVALPTLVVVCLPSMVAVALPTLVVCLPSIVALATVAAPTAVPMYSAILFAMLLPLGFAMAPLGIPTPAIALLPELLVLLVGLCLLLLSAPATLEGLFFVVPLLRPVLLSSPVLLRPVLLSAPVLLRPVLLASPLLLLASPL